MSRLRTRAVALLLGVAAAARAASPLPEWRGLSVSGAEFGEKHLPGVYEKDYLCPTVASTAYPGPGRSHAVRGAPVLRQ